MNAAEAAGDGTTTATLLAQTMIDSGLKKVEAGINAMEMKKGIDKGVKAVTEKLKQMAITVSTDSTRIEQVATISAGNNPEIGKLIAEAMRKAGKEGGRNIKNLVFFRISSRNNIIYPGN